MMVDEWMARQGDGPLYCYYDLESLLDEGPEGDLEEEGLRGLPPLPRRGSEAQRMLPAAASGGPEVPPGTPAR